MKGFLKQLSWQAKLSMGLVAGFVTVTIVVDAAELYGDSVYFLIRILMTAYAAIACIMSWLALRFEWRKWRIHNPK